jgi:hypothetical protein
MMSVNIGAEARNESAEAFLANPGPR